MFYIFLNRYSYLLFFWSNFFYLLISFGMPVFKKSFRRGSPVYEILSLRPSKSWKFNSWYWTVFNKFGDSRPYSTSPSNEARIVNLSLLFFVRLLYLTLGPSKEDIYLLGATVIVKIESPTCFLTLLLFLVCRFITSKSWPPTTMLLYWMGTLIL